MTKHAERMNRARLELSDPPKARTHAERMAAARGIHLHADSMRMSVADRRRIAAYRQEANNDRR